jgi:hypothetical protein
MEPYEMLSRPFIDNAKINDRHIAFLWDEWSDKRPDQSFDEAVVNRLQAISQRAVVGFTIATAEWIASRFERLMEVTRPRQYLEAAWAQQIDMRYGWTWPPFDNWTGPIHGSLRVAVQRVAVALANARDDQDPSWSGATCSHLAESVMSVTDPYRLWRNDVLTNLEKLRPFNGDDPLGDVVPPQMLDPDFDRVAGDPEAMMNQYLRRLDWRSNPFLSAPQMMLSNGYRGTPYMLDMAEDRRRRIN